MVGLLVRLKLRLLRNGLRYDSGRAVSFYLGGAFGVLVGFGVALALASQRGKPAAADVAVIVVCVLAVGWVLLPVLVFGNDETLDVSRLAVLPVSARRLVPGLLAGALIGIGPVTTTVVLVGVAISVTASAASVPVAVLAVVSALVLCVAVSRAVVAAAAGLLRSRRGRDLAVLLGVLAGTLGAVGNLVVRSVFAPGHAHALHATAAVLRWLPPAWPVDALTAIARGLPLIAIAALAGVLVVVGLVLLWWARSITRQLTSVDASTVGSARGAHLFPAVVGRMLPRRRWGAVTARELRYLWREPRRRAQVASTIAVGVVVPFTSSLAGGGGPGPHAVFGITLIALLGALQTQNQFGLDGSATWTNFVSAEHADDLRADVLGKNVAVALVTVPALVLAGTLLAGITGGWRWLGPALGLSIAVLGVALGLADACSVRATYPVPERPANAFSRGNAGQGCAAGLLSVGLIAVTGLICTPLIVGVFLARASTAGTVAVSVTGLLVAIVAGGLGIGRAARDLAARGPELLTTISALRTS